MADDVPELMTVREAAKTLGVHPSTLRNWERSGRLRAVRVGARRDRKFNKEDVLAAAEGGVAPRYATLQDLAATSGQPTLAEVLSKLPSMQGVDRVMPLSLRPSVLTTTT